jgi:predicted ester cyclase
MIYGYYISKGGVQLSAAENRALIQRVYTEGFNQGLLSVVDEMFASHFLDRSTPDQSPGIEGVKAYIRSVRAGFPDIAVTIEDLIATEERVVVRTTWCGTHLATYENLAPTGKPVMRTMIQIFRVEDGKLCEEWSEGGDLGQQILA